MSEKKYKINEDKFNEINDCRSIIKESREAIGIHQEIIAELTARNLGIRMEMNKKIIAAMEEAGIPEDERNLENFKIDANTKEFIPRNQ